jgi:hypothetical protein
MKFSERAQYIRGLVEQERAQARRDAERECELVINDAASRGAAQSGATIVLRLRTRVKASERVLQRRISAEEEVLSKEREAAPSEWRGTLADDIRLLLAETRQYLVGELEDDVRRILGAKDPSPFVPGEVDQEMQRLSEYYIREVELLHGRFSLDSEARAREAKVVMGNVTINIHHGTVGTLNLGTIIGDIEANLSTLKADGHDQVVEALKRLTEAIGNAQELGDGRREALEQVALISAEAEKPPAERRLGAVKAVLTALQAALSASASLIRVGEFAWPYIKNYFNLG